MVADLSLDKEVLRSVTQLRKMMLEAPVVITPMG